MTEDSAALPELQVLGPDARKVVSVARSEAQRLGHRRIGTEHLLLGLLADQTGEASHLLASAGAGRAAVWTKVREATAADDAPSADPPEEATPRAARALRRSVRFSHRRHTDEVTPEDLLLGVLDVEGTAGQVLRSLGVDLDDLRGALDGTEPENAGAALSRPAALHTCPSCAGDLTAGIVHRTVSSQGDDGTRAVLVHACPGCGTALGVTPA